MNILVTGGLGFIGHNVVRELESLGHSVAIVDTRTNYGIIPQQEVDYLIAQRIKTIKTTRLHRVDIVDYNGIDWIMRTYKPELVIHLASFPRQKVVNANPLLGAKYMSEGLLNLLENSVKHNVDKFVYISSSMVYGDFADDIDESANTNPIGQYGILKLAGEWLVKDYARRGLKTTIIRPSAVYGPRDVDDRVLSKFMLAALRDETLTVKGANEVLDFTYVEDTARGIVQASLSKEANGNCYNITRSSPNTYTLLNAAKLCVKLAGSGRVECTERDLNFPSRGRLSIKRACIDFNYNPTVDLEEGLKRYHEWYLQNPVLWRR